MFSPQGRSQPISFLAFLFTACLLLGGIASAAPSITLSKKTGPPTSRILVSGRGFAPNVGVDIYFDTKDEALAVTNSRGEFHNAGAYAPRSAYPGQHWVTALQRSNDKGAQKQFLVQTNWSQFHFDADGTRVNPYENVLDPRTVRNLELKWTFSTGENFDSGVQSSAAVADGVVYIGGYYTYDLYALNANSGALLWSHGTGGLVISSPAVKDGVVYFGSGDNHVYALRAKTGDEVWIHAANGPVYPSPVVVNASVFIGSYDEDNIFALNASTGALLWSYTADGPVFSSPAFADGVVYIGSEYPGQTLYALNAKTGAVLWKSTASGSTWYTPTVWNGMVYVGANDGNLYALDASTGATLWKYTSDAVSTPAVANGVVYVGSGDGLLALDAYTGALRWSYATGDLFVSSPAVANGVVYVGSWAGNVCALDAETGILLWDYPTETPIHSSPAVSNGMVYVASDYSGSYDGYIYAFGLPDGANQDSARPDLRSLLPDFSLKPSGPAAKQSAVKL
jgi:outer membrane protein assembly factor BamB